MSKLKVAHSFKVEDTDMTQYLCGRTTAREMTYVPVSETRRCKDCEKQITAGHLRKEYERMTISIPLRFADA